MCLRVNGRHLETCMMLRMIRLKEETKNDDPPQQLMMTEYDRPVDRVVFVPRKRHDVDTRQKAFTNLRTFLGNIQMERYYEEFKMNGLDNKDMLSRINENILHLLQISNQSHRAAILKAVSSL
eukprot:729201_1